MERERRYRRRHSERKRDINYSQDFNHIVEFKDVKEKFKKQDEDVLKFVFEGKNEKNLNILLREFLSKINGNPNRILKRLVRQGLIKSNNNSFSLTSVGKQIAEEIYDRHIEIEHFIKRRKMACDAHEMAHILEHKLSKDTIKSIIKISELKNNGKRLNEFLLPFGTIVDVNLPDCKVWTKIISMGIFPSQKIHIIERSVNTFLIEVKKSRIAIDRTIAEGILLIP